MIFLWERRSSITHDTTNAPSELRGGVGRRFSSSSSCYRTTRFTSVHHTPSRRTSSPTAETRSGSSQWPASSSPFIWARGGIQLESPRPEKSSSSGPRNCIQVLSKLLNSLPRLRLLYFLAPDYSSCARRSLFAARTPGFPELRQTSPGIAQYGSKCGCLIPRPFRRFLRQHSRPEHQAWRTWQPCRALQSTTRSEIFPRAIGYSKTPSISFPG